jgi:hypothetical protein
MKTLFTSVLLSISLLGASLHAEDSPQKNETAQPVVVEELLSKHETIAEFKGIRFHSCMGRTALCPESCGHSGEDAIFEIKSYTNYQKPGEYGDAKQSTYRIRVSDFSKKPVGDAAINEFVRKLKKGDQVILNWNHNYVTTKYPDGTQSKGPARTIVKLVRKD